LYGILVFIGSPHSPLQTEGIREDLVGQPTTG
jgi:hypothetical protein